MYSGGDKFNFCTVSLQKKTAMSPFLKISLEPSQPLLSPSSPQGFPRSALDLPAVRSARHQLACLTNDHKALTREIETSMHALHAAAGQAPAPPAAAAHKAAPVQVSLLLWCPGALFRHIVSGESIDIAVDSVVHLHSCSSTACG